MGVYFLFDFKLELKPTYVCIQDIFFLSVPRLYVGLVVTAQYSNLFEIYHFYVYCLMLLVKAVQQADSYVIVTFSHYGAQIVNLSTVQQYDRTKNQKADVLSFNFRFRLLQSIILSTYLCVLCSFIYMHDCQLTMYVKVIKLPNAHVLFIPTLEL